MFKVVCLSESSVSAFEMHDEKAAKVAATRLNEFGVKCFVVADYPQEGGQILFCSPGHQRRRRHAIE